MALKDLASLPVAEVIEAHGDPGSHASHWVELELMRRETEAQINSANYMRYSVIAITITSGLNALFAFLAWYYPHH